MYVCMYIYLDMLIYTTCIFLPGINNSKKIFFIAFRTLSNFISNLEPSFAYSYFRSFFEDCINVFGTNFTNLLVPSFNNTLNKNVAMYLIHVCRSILTTFSSFWIWCLKYGVLLTRNVLPLQGSWDLHRQANLSKISVSHTCLFFCGEGGGEGEWGDTLPFRKVFHVQTTLGLAPEN